MTPISGLLALLLVLVAPLVARAEAPELSSTPTPVSVLVQRLADADPQVREQAAAALGRWGPQASEAVAPLMVALGHDDPYLRGAAAVALGQIGEAALPALTQALASEHTELRWSAAIALGRLGAPAIQALPELIRLLADPSEQVRQVAAVTLGDLGAAARAAAPAEPAQGRPAPLARDLRGEAARLRHRRRSHSASHAWGGSQSRGVMAAEGRRRRPSAQGEGRFQERIGSSAQPQGGAGGVGPDRRRAGHVRSARRPPAGRRDPGFRAPATGRAGRPEAATAGICPRAGRDAAA